MKLNMGMLLVAMSVSSARDFSDVQNFGLCSFSGKHSKKQNKLSQKSKKKAR